MVASWRSNAGVASVSPKLNVIPPIAILELSNALLGILVREAPEPEKVPAVTIPVKSPAPEKVVAVTIPVTFMLPVPVILLELRSKLPPSCGVVSPTISVVIPVRLV